MELDLPPNTFQWTCSANEGLRPVPHSVDSIDRDGQTIYRYRQAGSGTISSVDRAAFYQLKSMMQGVLARGTARAISGLAPYVSRKRYAILRCAVRLAGGDGE